MQPVQLSLLPEQAPAPPGMSLDQIPAADIGDAVAFLGRLITRMYCPPVSGQEEDAGE